MGSSKDIEFGGPAYYRIVAQGTLSRKWSGRLAGMTIQTGSTPTGAARTTLVGKVRDQAELSGVLNALVSLHLPILSVEKLEGEA